MGGIFTGSLDSRVQVTSPSSLMETPTAGWWAGCQTPVMATHIHRVIVRGFFDGPDDRRRALLRAAQPDHDILPSSFSTAGSLTYGPDVAAFSFRFEVRTADDDGPDHHDAAMRIGMERAAAALQGMGVGHKHLRATAANMADIWRDA